MTAKTLVVRTKLVPPRLHRRILHRERLSVLLAAGLDYRLTILQAGAGYGKTTALAALQEGETPLAWYHLSVEDCDPLVFLLHLIYCFDGSLPGVGRSLAALARVRRDASMAITDRGVTMHYYDLYAPLVASVDLKYTPEEAQQHVFASVTPLGSEYAAVVRRAFSER